MTVIVSAYYKIPSKESHEWYLPHLVRFFRGISGNVVFFTTPDVIDDVRKHTPTDHVKIVHMRFEDLYALGPEYGLEFWKRQCSRDPEKYHTPELGIIWYEKREFIRKAMDIVPDADVYIWCDAGVVRDDTSENSLKLFGRRNLFDKNDGRIHLEQLAQIIYSEFHAFPKYFLAGGLMCGNKTAWEAYRRVYDETLKKYDSVGIPGISDQYITQSCVCTSPELFTLHPEETPGNPWLKFLTLL